MTVRNDPEGVRVTLRSLRRQTREPSEIVIVDGGSDDETVRVLRNFEAGDARICVILAPDVNIAEGRNLAARQANGEVLACIDSGCRAEPDWLQRLVEPFESDGAAEFVAGTYRIEPQSLLEEVVGLATMRGQLEPIQPETFNPSARSMACSKALWRRAGGWPEWLCFSEDTVFDRKVRRMQATWHVAHGAVVHWRPRRTLRAVARQFYRYGTGRGHTRIGASSFVYNLRNLALVGAAGLAGFVSPWFILLLGVMFAYFYVWTFHDKATRIVRRTRRAVAYPLCLIVMWVVLVSNLMGFLVGSWQRRRDRDTYERRLEAYLATP